MIVVEILDTSYFLSKNSGNPIEAEEPMEKRIPSQMEQNGKYHTLIIEGLTKAAEDAATVMKGGANGVVIGNLLFNIFMSGSMQMLWSMINTVQIIVLTPLMGISTPANVKMFFSTLIDMANFDVMPVEVAYSWALNFTESPVDCSNFSDMGFEDNGFIQNLGLVFIMFVFLLFGILLYFLSYHLR